MSWFGFIWDASMALIAAFVVLRIAFICVCALLDRLRRGDGSPHPIAMGHQPQPVTIVIPMYNESMAIQATLQSILNTKYPTLEILVIDDGSTDGCGALVSEFSKQHANIQLITQRPNQGKPAALNQGFKSATNEIVITIDADTQLKPDALLHMVHAMQHTDISAVACNLHISNIENWITRWQSLEYIAALSLDRRAQHVWGTITTVPGAASAWRKETVLSLGGFSGDTLTEDADMSLTLLRHGYRIQYLPTAHAYTLAPATLGSLLAQRRRWIYGNIQCIRKHIGLVWDGSPLALKILGGPNFLFSHLLSFGLFALTVAYIPRATQWMEFRPFIGLVLSILLTDLCICALAIWIDRGPIRLLFDAPVQRLGLPTFLFGTFITVWVSVLRRSPIQWKMIRRPKFRT